METNLNSDFFDKKGRLWFGTSSGLVRFDYKNHKKKKISPVLNLKSILLNYSKDELLKFSESKDGKPFNINLPYNKNNLAFEIDGVSEEIAKEALYKASAKLPIKTKFIKRFV